MSLYNVERPMTLEEVRGQENIKAQLNGMFQTMNVPNAMLLVGPRGTGKTTIARIVARRINCENGSAEVGCTCKSCKAILSGTSPDVIELDAASNNKVEDVARIVDQVRYAPDGKFKVFILDEVHMFSTGAWNSLLKTLEEPPSGVRFILCTTEEHKVPATIISRSRKLYFDRIQLAEITDTLLRICEKHGKDAEEDALKLIAKASDGCMRDALSILEGFFDTAISVNAVVEVLGACKEDVVFDILDAIQTGDVTAALTSLREATSHGASMQSVVKAMMEGITDAMFVTQGADVSAIVNTDAYKKRLASFVSEISMDRLIELSKRLSDVYGNITKSADAAFLVESAFIGMINYQSELALLKNRLQAVEQGAVAVKKASVADPIPTTEPIVQETEESVAATEEDWTALYGDLLPDEEPIPVFSDGDADVRADDASTPVLPEENVADKLMDETPDEQVIPVGEDADLNEILSHLPAGTVVVTDNSKEKVKEETEVPFAEDVVSSLPTPPTPTKKDTGILGALIGEDLAQINAEELGDFPFFQNLLEAV